MSIAGGALWFTRNLELVKMVKKMVETDSTQWAALNETSSGT